MWSTHFCGFVLNFRCRHSFLSASATIRSEKRQRQTAQFLKYGVTTTHFRLPRTATALSLNLASQNLMSRFILPRPCPSRHSALQNAQINPTIAYALGVAASIPEASNPCKFCGEAARRSSAICRRGISVYCKKRFVSRTIQTSFEHLGV